MELENEINNNIIPEKSKENFLNTIIGKTINSAIDMGLRAILPDLIENQIIEIKDSLIENGLKEGINTAINNAIDFGKSALGIFTGHFQNISQVQTAIGDGGIIDTVSILLDKTSNKAYELGYINNTINKLIKSGKNVILDNISSNIENELINQTKATEKLEKYIKNWKEKYKNKDFEGMEKEYKKIEEQIEKVIPLENILKETRTIENMHRRIANNGHNFEISELEKALIKKF